ncbi:MAG TPA: IS5 family transposase [Azospirillum sp.]|nr:IS5 family transposase [Azospirillum sp.]
MWTPEDRRSVGPYGAGQALSDEQLALLTPYIPAAKPGGRPRTTDVRRVLDALFYLLRTGCQWRHLPPHFPPWPTVYGYFRAFLDAGVWEQMHHELVMAVRASEGRAASPTLGILDSQSVASAQKRGACGYDAAKKISGRKRHLLVDCRGLVLSVLVHPADVQDRDAAHWVLGLAKPVWCWLRTIVADGAYRGSRVTGACLRLGWDLIIVFRRKKTLPFGPFEPVPKRWIVIARTMFPSRGGSGRFGSNVGIFGGSAAMGTPLPG